MSDKYNLKIEEMILAGLEKGRLISKTHPAMLPYVAGVKTPFYIINLEKTKEKFQEALNFIELSAKEGKKILVVETRGPFRKLVENFAKECHLNYVNWRWVGGTLTNFSSIKKRVDYLQKLKEEKEKGIWDKYTKKERMLLEKELEKLSKKFSGLEGLENLPDILLVLNPEKDNLAVREAQKKGIKIVAVCDTNCDPTKIDFPIPASNNSFPALAYILEKIKLAILPSQNDRENQKIETAD